MTDPRNTSAFRSAEDAKLVGKWIRAALFNDPRARAACARADIVITKAQSTGINSAGGFLAPEQLATAIFDIRDSFGLMRKYAFVPPLSAGVSTWPRTTGNISAQWVAEGASPTESTAIYDGITATVKKLMIVLRSSSELFEDSDGRLANWLALEAGRVMAQAEDQAGFIGDGTSTYAGIRGLAKILIGLKGAVTATGHSTLLTLDSTDLGSLVGAAPVRALPNAAFYCSPVAFGSVFGRLAAASGGLLMMNGEPHFGAFPVRSTPTLPGSGTITGQVAVLFGDLRMSTMLAERRQLTIALSQERYLDSDQFAWRITERADIISHDVGDSVNPGAVVALVAG